MKALFKKDFYALKESKTLILVMLFVVVIMAVWGGGESAGFILSYVTVLSSVLVLNTIGYDEMDNNYAFLLTMPFSRKQYAAEKYIFGLITGAAGWIFSMAVILATSDFSESEGLLWRGLSAAALCLVFLLQALLIPIQLKFGGQKGRIVMLILLAAIVGGIAAAAATSGAPEWIGAFAAYMSFGRLCAAGFAFTLLCLLLSFRCSVRIMERKEF